MASYRELVVWQKAFALCLAIYRGTEGLPVHERYGLTTELRKTARSVVCNIAEGHRRSSAREFARFLDISQGSAAELETQLLIADALSYFQPSEARRLIDQTEEVSRMLVGLKLSVRSTLTASPKQPTTNY